jgi:glycogen phosphorylase
VPAGHDRFPANLVEEHLGPLRDKLGISPAQLMGLGRVEPQNEHEPFCMTVIGLKLSRRANAVSSLHGYVSRRMWANLWPWRVEEEVPIGHITNGVHVPTWLAAQMKVLYDRVLPAKWHLRTGEPDVWADFEQVPPGELWETHTTLKNRLITYARNRMVKYGQNRNLSDASIQRLQESLDRQTLLIGFARRFAPYKRASLLLRRPDALEELLSRADRPVHFVFAGKAHPSDENGKALVADLLAAAGSDRFSGRISFIPDYDMAVARAMVQGCDVWLNNPIRPREASGTSGEKVVLNGALNCSILDGWWAEMYDGRNGWEIVASDAAEPDHRDDEEAASLMATLDAITAEYHDARPLFLGRIRHAWATLGPRVTAARMLRDYEETVYRPVLGDG